jgi:hypothetical protein
MAIEVANHLNAPVPDVGDLFPATNPCENCSIPVYWTSPLTCQWFDKTSGTYVEAQMMLLAELAHRWLATFFDRHIRGLVLNKDLLEERANLRQQMERIMPMARTTNTESEAMYECCRWASLMLLAVEKLSIPIHVAAKHVRIQPRLIRCLRMTDLANLWGIHKGLLFWVASICHFATDGVCFPLLSTTLFARFVHEIAMSDLPSEIAIKPLKRLKQFESLCCRPKPANQDPF